MSTHDVQLAAREDVAEGTTAFHFDKPPGFTFKPGQAIDLLLPTASSETQSPRHTFSIVSAPFQEELAIATRMRDSAYKRTLGSLPVGAALRLEGPFGSLTLHNDRSRAAVLVAGGIGITPFMSMLRQAAKDRLAQDLALLYSNRRPEDAAFLAELLDLERLNPRFHLVATMTEMSKSSREWRGETRLIGEDLIRTVGGALPAPIYYLVGPPAMVDGVRKTLNSAHIDDDDIRSEEFYGY